LTTFANHALGYDDSGNLTNVDTYSMGYRPDGLRAWQLLPGVDLTYYVHTGGKLLYSFDSFGNIRAYRTGLFNASLPLQQLVYFDHPRQMGTAQACLARRCRSSSLRLLTIRAKWVRNRFV
jgi:hypothetical protein